MYNWLKLIIEMQGLVMWCIETVYHISGQVRWKFTIVLQGRLTGSHGEIWVSHHLIKSFNNAHSIINLNVSEASQVLFFTSESLSVISISLTASATFANGEETSFLFFWKMCIIIRKWILAKKDLTLHNSFLS